MGKLFYGTMTGNTIAVAKSIKAALSDVVDEARCIGKVKADDFKACDFLILGGSTWGDGELTDDWADFLPKLDLIDFKGKTVAFFALGDQFGYGHNFVSGMRLLYDRVKARGAKIIASDVSTEGFDYSHSESVIDGHFVGLVIDETNEPDMTRARITNWVAKVRQQLPLTAR